MKEDDNVYKYFVLKSYHKNLRNVLKNFVGIMSVHNFIFTFPAISHFLQQKALYQYLFIF